MDSGYTNLKVAEELGVHLSQHWRASNLMVAEFKFLYNLRTKQVYNVKYVSIYLNEILNLLEKRTCYL